ncbi:hypothetical protein HK100_004561 [Physocladia obscura]|uniref:Uncharacterized protein n=1 Tax=Physocladia obscura TaxID=109957 RepID=A0AAD5XCJ0_9FUNG|nr:hypothetical protein HK100_004561 [Physocladia obscura]
MDEVGPIIFPLAASAETSNSYPISNTRNSKKAPLKQLSPIEKGKMEDLDNEFTFSKWEKWIIPGQDGHIIKLFKHDLTKSIQVWIANGYHYSLDPNFARDIDFVAISHCWLDMKNLSKYHENTDEFTYVKQDFFAEEIVQFLKDPQTEIWKKNRLRRVQEIVSNLRKTELKFSNQEENTPYDWFWLDLVSVNQSNSFAIRDASYVMSYVYHTASRTIVLHNNNQIADYTEWDSKCWTLQEKYLSRFFVHVHWDKNNTSGFHSGRIVKNKEMDKKRNLLTLLKMSFERQCNQEFIQDHVYCIRAFSKAIYDRPVVYTLDIKVLIAECAVSAAQENDFSMFSAIPQDHAHGFGMLHPVWKSGFFNNVNLFDLEKTSKVAAYLPLRVIPWIGLEFEGRLSQSFNNGNFNKLKLAGKQNQIWASKCVELNWSQSWNSSEYENFSPFRLDMICAFMEARVLFVNGPFFTPVSKFMESVVRLMDTYVSSSLRKKILEDGVTFEEALKWKILDEDSLKNNIGFRHDLEKTVVHNYLMIGPLTFHHAQCVCHYCSAAEKSLISEKNNGDIAISLAFKRLVFADRVRYGPEWKALVPNLISTVKSSPTTTVVLIWLYLELGFVELNSETKSQQRHIIFSVSHTGVKLPFLRNVNTKILDFVQNPDNAKECKIMSLHNTNAFFGDTPIFSRVGAVNEEVHNLASMISFKDGFPRPVTLDEISNADPGFAINKLNIKIVVKN